MTVWWDDARYGRLPPVCVGTGQPADKLQTFRELAPPLAVWFTIALLPFAMFAYWLNYVGVDQPSLRLPVSSGWSRQLRRESAVALLPIPIAVAFLGVAAQSHNLAPLLVALAGAAALTSLLLAFVRESHQPRRSHRLREHKSDPYYIELRNVHPAFAEACEADTIG